MVGVAQLVELLVVVQVAAGSSPVTHPKLGRCMTASAVRCGRKRAAKAIQSGTARDRRRRRQPGTVWTWPAGLRRGRKYTTSSGIDAVDLRSTARPVRRRHEACDQGVRPGGANGWPPSLSRASIRCDGAANTTGQRLRRHHAERLFTQVRQLVERQPAIQSDTQPPPVTDVGWAEELLGSLRDEICLYALGGGTPQMRKVVVVVTVGPHVHERLPAPDEESRGPVTQPFLHLRQRKASPADMIHRGISGVHPGDCRASPSRWYASVAYAPLAQLAEQLTLNQRVRGSSP
jgi:hypothetical protein